MLFADALTLDAPRRTQDGYLAVRAKAARTGVYQYTGREVDPDNAHGLRDHAIVHVLRDENTVFDKRSAHSFVGKPVTDDHPLQSVNADNWRDHARGVVMGAMREGDHLAFDILLTDAPTIAKVDAGKVELSNGYVAALSFGDFTAPDGTKCQARQDSVSGNHVAIVDRGRAGSTCRIGDARQCFSAPQPLFDSLTNREPEMTTKTITFDGLPLLVTDAAEAAIGKRDGEIKVLTDAKVKAEAQNVTDAATIVAKDAEIVKLKADLAAAKITPQQMRDAAKAYALTCDKAKAAGITVTDAMDEAAIKRAVVDKSMGEAAKGYSDEHVSIAFDALTKDAAVIRHTAPNGNPKAVVTDSHTFYRDAQARRRAELSTAWETPVSSKATA